MNESNAEFAWAITPSQPLPSLTNCCPGKRLTAVDSFGNERYNAGIIVTNKWVVAMLIRITGNGKLVKFNATMNVATKLLCNPGIIAVIEPIITPMINAINVSNIKMVYSAN